MSRNSTWLLFGLSLFGSAVSCFTFIAATIWSLPPQSEISKNGFWMLLDPFALVVTIFAILFASLMIFPLLFWCLRHKKLLLAYPIVLGATLLDGVMLPAHLEIWSVPVMFLTTCAALLICRSIRALDL